MLASLNLKYPPEQHNTVSSNMMYMNQKILELIFNKYQLFKMIRLSNYMISKLTEKNTNSLRCLATFIKWSKWSKATVSPDLFFYFFFQPRLWHVISVPQPGNLSDLGSRHWEHSLNHWTTREVPDLFS